MSSLSNQAEQEGGEAGDGLAELAEKGSSPREHAAAGSGGFCPSDGRNCEVNKTACTCPPGDGLPFDMAAGTTHPGW